MNSMEKITYSHDYRLFPEFFVSFETKRYCFGFDVNYFQSGGYYPIRRTLVITMSTSCTKDKQSRENMFLKYHKDNRQQDQTLIRFITNRNV